MSMSTMFSSFIRQCALNNNCEVIEIETKTTRWYRTVNKNKAELEGHDYVYDYARMYFFATKCRPELNIAHFS